MKITAILFFGLILAGCTTSPNLSTSSYQPYDDVNDMEERYDALLHDDENRNE
ncbi:hypothetical protein [Photobacterium sp.]|uniref:hypothetical protein n=1 Tax=Photobacterium sp. TaxID=660 RepID=UPI00299EF289|nr:hypothetical protein [Photobacterium sp.]MDX1301338.1 hypothetical protein [Photobacterium sp.]